MEPTEKLQSMGTQSKETVDAAAAKARDVVDSSRTAADQTMKKVGDKIDDAKDSASAALDKAAGKADKVVDMAKDRFDGLQTEVRAKASDLSNQIADYTQEDPIKAMLIAAAAGAALMGLLSLIIRS